MTTRPSEVEVRTMAAAERWQELLACLSGITPEEVDSAAIVVSTYKAYTAVGQADSAEPWLDRALALLPENATFWRNKGNTLSKRGEVEEAVAAYQRAVSLRPDVASYHASLAVALQQLARHSEAGAALNAALAIDPNQRGWWIRAAQIRLKCDQLEEASHAYLQALALKSDPSTQGAYDELRRQLISGTKAASSQYYDAVFADSEKYAVHGEHSDYVDVWNHIVRLLVEHRGTAPRILDLGCGPGQFAEFIAAKLPQATYFGVDFSAVAIGQAKRRVPGFKFERLELPLSEFSNLPEFDVVVCTEVLEHVELDREIISSIPAGVLVVASVPNFDAFGHLRTFRDAESVRERYGALFNDGLTVEAHNISASSILWVMSGTRRVESADLNGKVSSSNEAIIVGEGGLSESVVDSVFLSDGTRYLEDFLPRFGLRFVPIVEAVELAQKEIPHVALRHDVDWSLTNALAMANGEYQQGIRSSYYLLHPDGDVITENYFGCLESGRLIIDPMLFEHAKRLIDLGHEVGLHNDLISLCLVTGRNPRDYLEQICEAFAKNGIPLKGSVSHGSRSCRTYGYMNHQIFSELEGFAPALDYWGEPEQIERFANPVIEVDTPWGARRIVKYGVSMGDFGLSYEANYVPRSIYLYDSSSRWTLWDGLNRQEFPKNSAAIEWQSALSEAFRRRAELPTVQVLVHPCHWGPVMQFNSRALPGARARRDTNAAMTRRRALVSNLAHQSNVIYVDANERFDSYDEKYLASSQLYTIASTVSGFVDRIAQELAANARSILEIGCGQGEFLYRMQSAIAKTFDGPIAKSDWFLLGVDGSAMAVLDAATRYADLKWACAPLESFVERHDEVLLASRQPAPRYDLVLDKTGAIFIQDYASAKKYFADLAKLMAPGGLYVYVASRNYYHTVLCAKTYANWPMDWIAIAEDLFELVLTADDDLPSLRGYIKRVFRLKNL